MDEMTADNPAGADAPAQEPASDGAGAVQPTTDDTPQTDAAAGDGQAAEDDGEDIEHDGKTYRVPKELKESFLRQADYTRKTQELAENRRALESEQARVKQMDTWAREHAVDLGNLVAIDNRLAAYQNVNWQAENARDPVATQAAWIEFQQLRDARNGVVNSLQQRDAQRTQQQRAEHAKQLEAAHAQLAREIPGWNEQKMADLGRYGIDKFGLKADEVDNLSDARLVRILHKAFLWDQHETKQRAAARQATASPPAQPVTVIGARKAPVAIAASNPQSDRLSIDEWAKRRNAELARAGR